MKKILITIIGVIVVAAAGFFLPGVLNPEIEYENRVVIKKPRAEVWRLFNDESKMGEWLKGFKSIELVKGKKGEVGSEYVLITEDENEIYRLRETVTEIKPEETYGFTLEADPLFDHVKVTFSDKGDDTEVVQAERVRGKNLFWRALFYWMSSSLSSNSKETLGRLKKFVEAQ